MFRHRFDPSSLIAGILFLGFGLHYLDEGTGGHAVSYTAPATVAAIVVIVVLRRAYRRRRDG